MDDRDALLWNAPKLPARKPRPLEPLWSTGKDDRQIDCGLLRHGEFGWECQLRQDGEWYYGRRFITPALALVDATEIRTDLERKGWTLTESV